MSIQFQLELSFLNDRSYHKFIMRINVVVALVLQVTFDMKNETYVSKTQRCLP